MSHTIPNHLEPRRYINDKDETRTLGIVLCRESGSFLDKIHALADKVRHSNAFQIDNVNGGRQIVAFQVLPLVLGYLTLVGSKPIIEKR